jgi:hypothetical protein
MGQVHKEVEAEVRTEIGDDQSGSGSVKYFDNDAEVDEVGI